MADVVTPGVRSRMMSGIKNKNTKPELLIRSALHRRGFRYRLHAGGLPGRPDLVLRKYKAVIFAHGCLWHRHECHLFKWPCKDNLQKAAFWKEKIDGNRSRDLQKQVLLVEQGWRVAVVWECALKGKLKLPLDELTDRLDEWLLSDDLKIELIGAI